MKKNLNIGQYLDAVDDNFSGMDGEFYDGSPDFGMNDRYSPVEGGAMPQKEQTPTPYQVLVSNTTGAALNVVLFGYTKNALLPNFGSDAALVVTTGQASVPYSQLLTQSAFQPFETSYLRVESTNNAQVTTSLTLTDTDASGESRTKPLVAQTFFSPNQFQPGIINIELNLTINETTQISSLVLANTSVIYTFYMGEKINTSLALGGKGRPIKQYATPNLGGNFVVAAPQPRKLMR